MKNVISKKELIQTLAKWSCDNGDVVTGEIEIKLGVSNMPVSEFAEAYKSERRFYTTWNVENGILTVTEKKTNCNYANQQISAKISLGYSM